MTVVILPAHAQLPTLGDGADMTVSAERKMGERIVRELYRDPDYIDDPLLGEYVQGIWQPLLAAARARGELSPELADRFAWEVLLGRDRSVNAFALPGGYLGLHLGLIGIVTTRDELASVLAHELTHVTQRHIARIVGKQNQQAPWLIGAMILGALAASKNPEAANAVLAGSQAVSAASQLSFSRDMEREADRIGFGIMTQAGFAPQGFVSMFDKLQQTTRLNDNGAFPYLRSHPLTTERIADMQSRLQLEARPGPVAVAPALAPLPTQEHGMVTARARVLGNPGVDILRGWVSEPDARTFATMVPQRQVAVLYAASLASMKQRDFARARSLHARLVPLATQSAAARLTRLLAVEIELAAGDAARAGALLDANAPGRPELFLMAQARLAGGSAEGGTERGVALNELAQRLQTWVASHPRDAAAWQWLGSTYAAQGQQLRAIRAEAESQAAHFDYQAAVDRFKAAQNLVRRQGASGAPGDHIEASIIDTRARQVEALLREQALER